RNSVHNSSGTNRSTRSVMHGSTSDHAIRNGVNRRLLRVAITRARHMVVFVRPEDAVPLIPRVAKPATVPGGA
ncbi:hypothetical protein AB0872_21900, partial [Microbacterium sp. NPDC047426]